MEKYYKVPILDIELFRDHGTRVPVWLYAHKIGATYWSEEEKITYFFVDGIEFITPLSVEKLLALPMITNIKHSKQLVA